MTNLVQGGFVLRQRFRLVRPLGEGGMGVVWEVEETATRRHLAIKFVRDNDRSEKAAKRLRREAEATSAIAHPNIVRVLEVAEEDDGAAAIVMELLDGESLGERLSREQSLSVGQTAAILQRVASALRAAHAAGVVHRDLKPDNVFLVTRPDNKVDVRVLDFGIAKHTGAAADTMTVTGTIMGTPLYMSPEQAAGERGLDARTDVWSIAVIAFECLTGSPPVSGDNYGQLLARLIRGEFAHLATVRPTLPADLLTQIDGALVSRDRRASDLAAMEATLARHADPEITRLAPRIVVQSDPSLPVAASSNNSLLETQAALPPSRVGAPRASGNGSRAALVVGVAVAAVLVAATTAYALYPRAGTTSSITASPSPLPSPSPSPSPSAAPSDTATPPPEAPLSSASALASPPPTSRPAAVHGPRGTANPRGPTSAAAPATTASAGQKRLQGGVAGDVPF